MNREDRVFWAMRAILKGRGQADLICYLFTLFCPIENIYLLTFFPGPMAHTSPSGLDLF